MPPTCCERVRTCVPRAPAAGLQASDPLPVAEALLLRGPEEATSKGTFKGKKFENTSRSLFAASRKPTSSASGSSLFGLCRARRRLQASRTSTPSEMLPGDMSLSASTIGPIGFISVHHSAPDCD